MQNEHATPPERRERRDAAANRRHILATARRLFAEQGIDKTSMHAIASAARVGQGTLYRRFAHKGALCEALLGEDLLLFRGQVTAALDDGALASQGVARLDWLIDELIRMTDAHMPLLAAFETEAFAEARRQPVYLQPFNVWLRDLVAQCLRLAIEQGDIVDLDVDFTADVLLSAIVPPLFAFHRQHCGYSTERISAGMRRLFIDRLRRLPQ